MWQEAPAEMKDVLYQVVNQVAQNGKMPTSWEGALTTLIPKKVGEEQILESTRPICFMNTAAKIVTSVKSLEQQSVLEGSQEGLRPDRSTRRQISCFISALQDVERNQGTICVTFLDFENYFNTMSLPALLLLLRKYGMNGNDVQALESHYEHSPMQVVHADGEKSAKIPLHRGLRQGCPLSPILGGVVVNAMLRWLDFKGGGLSQGDVVTNTLCFADDSTLMTTNVHDMNVRDKCTRYECSQHTATERGYLILQLALMIVRNTLQHTTKHCNRAWLPRTATHCNTLQQSVATSYCNSLS